MNSITHVLLLIHGTTALRIINSSDPSDHPHMVKFWGMMKDAAIAQRQSKPFHNLGVCTIADAGRNYGGHPICDRISRDSDNKCSFLSYGIQYDYSFDKSMENKYGCRGVAMDPTVNYPNKLPGTNVTFQKVAAPGNHLPKNWNVLSPLEASKQYHMKQVNVLKMDCEGCEYALMKSIEADPAFFERVDQFTAELHFGHPLLSDDADVEAFESLLKALDSAGLQVAAFGSMGLCGKRITGKGSSSFATAYDMWSGNATQETQAMWNKECNTKLVETGYACGLNCVNVLFARP